MSEENAARMEATMEALERIYPECAIVLLVTPFDAPKGARTNYISNADRTDVVIFLKEVVARFEGRAHDAPEKSQ